MSSKGSLKSRFENYGAAPSKGAWAEISGALPSSKKKKAAFWWFTIGTGIAASILAGLFLLNTNSNPEIANVEHIVDARSEITQEIQSRPQTVSKQEHIADSDFATNIATEETDLPKEKNKVQKTGYLSTTTSKDIANNNTKPLSAQNTDTATEGNNLELGNSTKVIPQEKSTSKTLVDDQKIDLLSAQKIPLLAAFEPDLLPTRMVEVSKRKSSWQWGIKMGSDFGTNALAIGSQASPESIIDAEPNNVNFDASLNPTSYTDVLYNRINRPASLSLLLRFSPNSKLFFEIDPTFILVKAKVDAVSLSNYNANTFSASSSLSGPSSSPFTFLSRSVGVSIGYKFLNKRRWTFDIAGGFNYENVQKTVNLFGNSVQIGINYYISETTSLRISPEYSWVYGKSENLFLRQFQSQRSMGFGLSFLRNF